MWSSSVSAPIITSAMLRTGSDPPGRMRAAAAERHRDAGDDQAGAEHDRAGERRARRAAPGRRSTTSTDGGDRARGAGVRPEGEVEEDPGAAGEREQREDEPDERRVDIEGRRDAAADARDHAVVVASFEREGGDLGHPARTTSTRPAPTRASR